MNYICFYCFDSLVLYAFLLTVSGFQLFSYLFVINMVYVFISAPSGESSISLSFLHITPQYARIRIHYITLFRRKVNSFFAHKQFFVNIFSLFKKKTLLLQQI